MPIHHKSVIVPVDFSDESLAAVDTGLKLAGTEGEVHVVHVLPSVDPAEPGVVWNTVDNATRSMHAEQALRERLADPRYAEVKFSTRFGDPGHEIAAFAQEIEAGIIVIPSHGRTGLSRLLIGSVAERVVRLAHCPVLVLKK
jgi:nucleotide-binding universal stress UspA family protein